MEDKGDLINILRKIFEANPGKSTIQVKHNCSDCGREIIISITSTAGGFGLQSGALFKCSPDAYLAKCPECYKNNPKIEDGRRTKKGQRSAVGDQKSENADSLI